MSRSRSACLAWIPRRVPLTKKRSSPLCRKLTMATLLDVTPCVTLCKEPNQYVHLTHGYAARS